MWLKISLVLSTGKCPVPPGHFFGGGDATWSQNKAGSGKLPEVSKVNNPKIALNILNFVRFLSFFIFFGVNPHYKIRRMQRHRPLVLFTDALP